MGTEQSDKNSARNDRKDDPFIDYPNLKVLDDYSGSDDRSKRVSDEIRAIIGEVK